MRGRKTCPPTWWKGHRSLHTDAGGRQPTAEAVPGNLVEGWLNEIGKARLDGVALSDRRAGNRTMRDPVDQAALHHVLKRGRNLDHAKGLPRSEDCREERRHHAPIDGQRITSQDQA